MAPYAGASVAESFRDQGGHALVIYDDLTKHADAYRELALLLGRPPGREAFPGDIFYVHAELLERAAALNPEHGGGTVTAFPLVETSDGDISAYIPTELDFDYRRSNLTWKKVALSEICVPRSISGVASHESGPWPNLRSCAASKNLKIELSRFESLEKLSRVGLDIDISTQATLKKGDILRAMLRQGRLSRRSVAHQVIMLTASTEGWVQDLVPRRAVLVADSLVRWYVASDPTCSRFWSGESCPPTIGSRVSAVSSHEPHPW